MLIVDCITEEFVEFLLLELEDDVDETVNSCICRLIVLSPMSMSINASSLSTNSLWSP